LVRKVNPIIATYQDIVPYFCDSSPFFKLKIQPCIMYKVHPA
jgi:hypothetical protein